MSKKANIGVEIERKYIIAMPDIDILSCQPEYTRSEITQIYIKSAPGETHRVRRRAYSDRVCFYETQKMRLDHISSTEIEGEISPERFDELALGMIEGTKPVVKTRHTFLYVGHTFEIDVYPEWRSTAIMETELRSREERAQMPEFIKILREVTGEKTYSNASMASAFPPEII